MNKLLFIVIAFLLLSISACRNSQRDLDVSTVSSHDFWLATNHFSNIFREVHKVAIVDSIIANRGSSALIPEVCLDSINRMPNTGSFPVELNIFYSESKECPNERNRSGKLSATFSKTYPDSGSVITINTSNYMVDGYEVSANISIEITSSTPWLVEYNVSVENGRIVNTKLPSKNIILESGDFKIASVDGFTTISALDDQFKYTGSGIGMATNGVIYSFENETDIFLYADCEYENTGIFIVKSDEQQDRSCKFSIDSETCNSKMLVTILPANGDQVVEIP